MTSPPYQGLDAMPLSYIEVINCLEIQRITPFIQENTDHFGRLFRRFHTLCGEYLDGVSIGMAADGRCGIYAVSDG